LKNEEQVEAVFVYSRELAGFELSPDHPFKPERARLTYDMCSRRGLLEGEGVRLEQVDAAEEGLLGRFHDPGYIELLKRAESGREVDLEMIHHGLGTAENPVFRGVHTYSSLAATATVVAARAAAEGCSSFNPCGGFHHAHRDRASGFCYVNDVAIAVLELRGRGIRVACVDIDAHHGNGIQDAFYEDREVLTISIHESGRTLFPWSGFESESGSAGAEGYNINIPLEPETDDKAFLMLFSEIVMDALSLFEPEVIVGVFGTDTFATDPLTHLRMTNNGYIDAIAMLRSRFPHIAALGGGGYNVAGTVRGWTLLWAELAGRQLGGGYGGALGGVLMGDPEIDESDLRDMHVYTSGPAAERVRTSSEMLVERYRRDIRPLIS
jgi:acetoin utilization protein AcuC